MPDPNVEPCPGCQQPVGTHTVDELAAHLAPLYDFDLPYQEVPETQQAGVTMAGSVAIKAGVSSSVLGHHPVLVFEFSGPGGPMPPIGLLLDDNGMRSLRTLVGQSIDSALKAARRRR